VVPSGWHISGSPVRRGDSWEIPFKHQGFDMQTWVRDRDGDGKGDENKFINDVGRAVGLAMAQSS